MGVNLKIIADHILDLGQPEKIIDLFNNRIDTSHLGAFYRNLLETREIRELPPENDIYRIYFDTEKYSSWSDSFTAKEELIFESALTTVLISRYKIEISYWTRFFPSDDVAYAIMEYVFGLISQIGGKEAIFMPDSVPISNPRRFIFLNPSLGPEVSMQSHWSICCDIYYTKIYKTGIPFPDIKQGLRTMYGEPSFSLKHLKAKGLNGYLIEDFRSYQLKKIVLDDNIQKTYFLARPKKKDPKWVYKSIHRGILVYEEIQRKQEKLDISKNYSANELATLFDPWHKEKFLNFFEKNSWPRVSDIKNSFFDDPAFKDKLVDIDDEISTFFEMTIDKYISLKDLYTRAHLSKEAYAYLKTKKINSPIGLRQFYYKIQDTYLYEKIIDKNNRVLQEIIDFLVSHLGVDDYRKLSKEAYEQQVEDWKNLVRITSREKR